MTGEVVRRGLRAIAVALLLGCTACQDYLARRDTLTLGSGEAVHANAALHVIDPWPRRSMTVDPYTDGERIQRGIERYRNPATGSGANAPAVIPLGPATAPSAAAPLQ